MTLGESIYYYRKKAGLSQEALAEQVGVSRQAVSRWELDDATPEVAKLKTLAEAFGVTVDQLLSGEEPKEPREAQEPYRAPGEASPSLQIAPKVPSDWDRLPGMVGRMVRRHGWIAGIYIMLQGLGVALVGGVARYAFGRMFRVVVNDMFGMGGGWASAAVDSMGNPVELPLEVMGDLFGGFGQVTMVSDMGRVFINIATVIIVLGLLVAVAGAILAAVLYRKGRQA